MTTSLPLALYLDTAYRQNVLGEKVNASQKIENTPEFKAALESERSRLKKLAAHVGNLAGRDFVAYQHLRAVEAALAVLKEKEDAS